MLKNRALLSFILSMCLVVPALSIGDEPLTAEDRKALHPSVLYVYDLHQQRLELERQGETGKVESITQRLSHIIAGQHGIMAGQHGAGDFRAPTTDRERSIYAHAIVKTRLLFPGEPDIMGRFYLSYPGERPVDEVLIPQLAVIIAIDTLAAQKEYGKKYLGMLVKIFMSREPTKAEKRKISEFEAKANTEFLAFAAPLVKSAAHHIKAEAHIIQSFEERLREAVPGTRPKEAMAPLFKMFDFEKDFGMDKFRASLLQYQLTHTKEEFQAFVLQHYLMDNPSGDEH